MRPALCHFCSETVQFKGVHVQAAFIAAWLFSLQARNNIRAVSHELEKEHE
jgi:hypothetical protein